VLPILYLRGLSTGDLRPAMTVLPGEETSGLSASSINRMTRIWEAGYQASRKRDLSGVNYVFVWVGEIHVNVRLGEPDRLCLLVMIGARPDGTKELITVEDGCRESTESRSNAT